MINVKSESQRIAVAIDFVKTSIEELNREIRECDYEEDPEGNMIFSPNCYFEEKQMYLAVKRKLEIVSELLTREIPFTIKN